MRQIDDLTEMYKLEIAALKEKATRVEFLMKLAVQYNVKSFRGEGYSLEFMPSADKLTNKPITPEEEKSMPTREELAAMISDINKAGRVGPEKG